MWGGDADTKQKAISAIRHILDSNHIERTSDRIAFLSLLMRYETTILTEDREDLKNSKNLGEITDDEYDEKFSEQRDSFFRIHKHPGAQLLDTIRSNELKDFDHETKKSCLNGLSSLIEVCLRRQMLDEIDEILTYVFNNLKYNYHDNLKRKLLRVNRIRGTEKKDYEEYIIPGSIGDKSANEGNPITDNTKKPNIGTFGKVLLTALHEK